MSDGEVGPLSDADARRAAATTFDRPITVEAGAGTGKTTLLIHRLLVWVLDTGWNRAEEELRDSLSTRVESAERIASRLLDGIVAITFTEAAAAELAERFVQAVAEATRGRLPTGFEREWLGIDDHAVIERARWLLPQADRAHISTIHAWCYELLRRHPYEAGVHPEVEIIADAQEIEAIAREVVEEHYHRAYRQGYGADLLRLGEEKLGPQDWVEMVRNWVVAGWDVGSHLPDEDGIAEALAAVQRGAAQLSAAAPTELKQLDRSPLTIAALEAAEATADLDAEDVQVAVAQLTRLWPDNLRKRVASWSLGDFNKTETAAVGGAAAEVTRAAAPLAMVLSVLKQIDPERWRRRQRVFRPLIEDVERELHDQAVITFGGLLRGAAALLSRNEAVAAWERKRMDLLLVDEFQDTDARQAELVESVALAGSATPALIVVGDPKQSIYGWRNADLETYERVRQAVIDRGGLELVLSRNFRSSRAILAATDRIAGSQMRYDPGFQPRYHDLDAGAPHADSALDPVDIWRLEDEFSAAEGSRLEAEWVAHDLATRHRDGEIAWHQAAILMRSKTHVRSMLRALRAEGIPYVMSADTGFHERSEVIDAVAWVRVIADPTDQVALLNVCRSPTVGLPDAALVPAWKKLATTIEGFAEPDAETEQGIHKLLAMAAESLVDVPGLDRIEGWVDHAAQVLSRIGTLRRSLRSKPFAAFLDELRDATRIEAIEARRPEGEARVANLDKLFDQLAQQVEDTGGDTHAVLRVLRRGILFELPAEEAAPLTPADGAVQVATIHAAKGLEFDDLYLVHFGTGGGREDTRLQVEAAVPGATLIQGVAHPQWAIGRQRRDRVAQAEALRLLYVALTRARRRLVVCLPRGARSNTLAHLVDLSLGESHPAIRETAIAESPPAAAPRDPRDGAELLPNPTWRPADDPIPLYDSPTRREDEQRETPRSSGAVGDRYGIERGKVVHRLLAELDLTQPQPELPEHLAADGAAREFWRSFRKTASARRLLSLGDRLRGREVDVLTPAGLLENESEAAYASGTIDLLYLDDATDAADEPRWVVADFKTGEPENLDDAIEHYTPQLRYYGRALTDSLSLDRPPRLELWFVDLDRVEVVG